MAYHLEDRSRAKPAAGMALAVVLLATSGCQTANTPEIQGIGKGERCVNDSTQCISERSAALNTLLVDKKNSWIATPPTSESYASGVRLFAYKTRKGSLSCGELTQGTREADGAPSVLRGPGGKGLTPAQVSRGLMFAAEVSSELKREARRKRCRT